METNPAFDKYMDRYFDYLGIWDSPSKCGLKIIEKKDGKTIAIASELYRQNPGTPVTEWCAPLATLVFNTLHIAPEDFIFIEHTPDLKSKLTFYDETFDLVDFDWDGEKFTNPKWSRVSSEEVDIMMG
ncbi:MAG: hypothetical protein WCL00_16270 [Bacteroidota bacterium]